MDRHLWQTIYLEKKRMGSIPQAVSGDYTENYNAFRGPNSLLAGWRLMIFLAFLVPVGYCASRASDAILNRMNLQYYTPIGGLVMMEIFADEVGICIASY